MGKNVFPKKHLRKESVSWTAMKRICYLKCEHAPTLLEIAMMVERGLININTTDPPPPTRPTQKTHAAYRPQNPFKSGAGFIRFSDKVIVVALWGPLWVCSMELDVHEKVSLATAVILPRCEWKGNFGGLWKRWSADCKHPHVFHRAVIEKRRCK